MVASENTTPQPKRGVSVLGPASLQQRFDTVRDNVIRTPRDASALRLEIETMRAKVRGAHADKDGQFDVKHSVGGMVDIEFAVQYLLLAHGQHHAELLPNVGNIALLQRAQACGAVNTVFDQHLAHVDARIEELTQLRAQLAALRQRCQSEPSPGTPGLTSTCHTIASCRS